MKKEVLRMEHVTIRHAGRNVLEDFHLNIFEGEFLFVYGYPDSGIIELGELLRGTRTVQTGIFFAGEKKISKTAFENPGNYGIYLIQNKNNLVDDFTVADNLFFGGKKRFFQRVVDRKTQELMAHKLLEKFGLNGFIDPSKKTSELSYADHILLKMVMAYARGAKLVVLDRIMGFDLEKKDTPLLQQTLRVLLNDKISVMWMNQRMDAAWDMADRVLIMQNGHNVRTVFKGYEGQLDHLLKYAAESGERVSRAVSQSRESDISSTVVFELEKLSTDLFRNLSMKVHSGEIVSICSTDSLIMQKWRQVVTGIERDYQGIMRLDGQIFRPRSYYDCVKQGVVFLDIMWYEEHCIPEMTIEDNIMIPLYWRRNGLRGFLRKGRINHARYLYRTNYPEWPKDYWWKLTADQQKALLLEKLCMEPARLVIITEPFFQLHNSMLENIYKLIRKIRDNNGALILMAAIDKDTGPVSDRVIYLDDWAAR